MTKFLRLFILCVLATALTYLPEPRRTISDGFSRPVAHEPIQALKPPEIASFEAKGTVPLACKDYRALVEKYDWPVDTMLAIARAESGCRFDAVGDTWPIAGVLAPSCGLFQVRTLPGRPTCDELKDARVNIEWAYKLYKSGGLNHWSVYTNGSYRQWL